MFTRARLPGFWTFGSAIAPSEMEHVDDYAYAIDGLNGGTYAPTALVTIGGSGLTVSGPLIATNAQTIDVNASLTINPGAQLSLNDNMVVGSGAIAGFTSGSFLTMSSGSTFTMNSGSTATIGGAATITSTGTVTLASGGSLTTNSGSVVNINGTLNVNTTLSLTKGTIITQSTLNTSAITATGNGIGSGIDCTGGALGPGMIANAGTPSTAAVPQCASKHNGFIEITAADPSQGVAPPALRHVIYGHTVAKAYCTVEVGTGGPYTKQDAFNIAVVDDVGTGNYSVTFITPMPTADYVIVLSTNVVGRGVTWFNRTTTGFRISVWDTLTQLPVATVVTVDLVVFGRR